MNHNQNLLKTYHSEFPKGLSELNKKCNCSAMPRHIQRSNAGKSVIRSRVEHVFADQKSQTG
ncbi:hypothetical protein FKW24_10960, partial [Acetobacter sp. DmW_125134]